MNYPTEAFIVSGNGQIAIGNAYLVRTLALTEENRIRTLSVTNRRTDAPIALEFQPCSEEFVVRVLVGRRKTAVIKSSMLTVADILTQEKDGKKFLEIRFAPLFALGVHYLLTEVYEIGDKPYMHKSIKLTADAHARIDSIDTEYISVPRDIKQKWSRPDMKKTGISEFHSALGQPIYLNGLFMGSEFPASDNNIEAGIARTRYYAGKTFGELSKGETEYTTWKTVFGAARSLDMEVIRADFLDYIRDISVPVYLRTQYNSWFDHMLNIDKDNIQNSFFEIEKGMTQNGVPPVHSYVVDDGWPDYDKGFWCFNQKFPNELYDSAALAKHFASDFGLWLGPRGGYTSQTPKFAKHVQKAGNGGYNRRSIDVCTAHHGYQEKLEDLFLDYMERFDINYWKLDGFLQRCCPSKKHGHPTGGYQDMYCFTDHWENWIAIFRKMRSARTAAGKSLWINQTSYSNASPWYLQFSESLWMQNALDIGFTDKTKSGEELHGKDYDKMLTYRDSCYFDFHRTRCYQFPLSNMYNHEPIYGNTAKIQMTDEEFRKYMYMISTRGTAFWELYYSFNLFNDAKWRINADVLKFIADNFHILRNAKLIGESPDTGAVYGYSAWEGAEGIVSVRNPLDRPQSFSFTLDRVIGVGEGAAEMTCATVLPYTETVSQTVYNYGDTVTLDLGAHEIRIFRFGKPETNAPRLLRAKMTAANTAQLTFDKHIVVKENAFTKDGASLDVTLLENYSEVRVTLPQALKNDEAATVQMQVTDMYGNDYSDSVEVTYHENGILSGAYTGNSDFTLRLQLAHAPKDGVLFTQGKDLVVSVSGGKLIADCAGLKVKSDAEISEKATARADIVRERNGMVKIYTDGVLSGGAYSEKHLFAPIRDTEVQVNGAVTEYTYYDTALPFDALK